MLTLLLLPAATSGQTVNGAITGVIKDSTGGVVADVAVTLRNVATDQTIATTVTNASGEYAFRNLPPGKYAVEAIKSGFQQVTHPDIDVTLSSVQRVEITLPIGQQDSRVEVVGGSSMLSVTGTQEHGIAPETLNQLPLLMNSGPRAAAAFATLMPGVSTGGGNNAFDARINGGLQSGDEASLDGVSMQQGFMSQGGMVSIFQDFPMSPDMVSEVKVLTSNYAPEYGSSTSGQIMAVTKSGGSSFHGAAFEFHRSDSLKATQWGAVERSPSSTVTTTAPTSAAPARCRACGQPTSRAISISTTKAIGRPAARTSPLYRFHRCSSVPATSEIGATPAATSSRSTTR